MFAYEEMRFTQHGSKRSSRERVKKRFIIIIIIIIIVVVVVQVMKGEMYFTFSRLNVRETRKEWTRKNDDVSNARDESHSLLSDKAHIVTRGLSRAP